MKKLAAVFAVVLMAVLPGAAISQTQTPTSIAGMFPCNPNGTTVIAPGIKSPNYHMEFFQAAGIQVTNGSASLANTDKVYICFNLAGAPCTPQASFMELSPGDAFGPITAGMYTGMTGGQLAGSILFNSDISCASLSGTQYVHAGID